MPRRCKCDEIGSQNLIKKQFYFTEAENNYLTLIQGINNLPYQVDALHQIIKEHHNTYLEGDKKQ